MGNLHDGHLSLIKEALSFNDHVVVSIYVNPLQFNNKDDLLNYPKTIKDDINLLESVGCNSLFIPDSTILNNIKKIKAPDLANTLCGNSRPGHFDGVLTIVNKLFSIVSPTRAFFGLKDFQQLSIIKDFVKKNNLPIDIFSVDIQRSSEGLALSSRNNLLSKDDLITAAEIYKALQDIKINKDCLSSFFIEKKISYLTDIGFKIEYLEICNPDTLEKIQLPIGDKAIVVIAAFLGNVRLIDNILIN